MKKKTEHVCVECKQPIPIYQEYLCEKCYQEMLLEKIDN